MSTSVQVAQAGLETLDTMPADQVFPIRAAGRSPAEVLAELRRRLRNDPGAEQREVAEQLRPVTRLRLERSLQS